MPLSTSKTRLVFLVGFIFTCVLLFVSILLLLLVFIPNENIFPYYETEFINVENLSLISEGSVFTGLAKISWGIWKACYSDTDNNTSCTDTHWITDPYTLYIMENGNEEHVQVDQSWIQVLFLQFVGLIFLIFIGIIHIALYFLKTDFRGEDWWNPKKNTMSRKVINGLTSFLLVWFTMIFIVNLILPRVIENAMDPLFKGENQVINTNLKQGYQMIVAVWVFIVLYSIVVGVYTNCKSIRSRRQQVQVVQGLELDVKV